MCDDDVCALVVDNGALLIIFWEKKNKIWKENKLRDERRKFIASIYGLKFTYN